MTVASLATTTQVVPSIRPIPVTIPARGRVVVVEAGGGQRAQLEEGRARVEQALDALADRQLAALPVALDRAVVATGAATGDDGLPARRSATSAAIASWFARVSTDLGSSRLRMTGMRR